MRWMPCLAVSLVVVLNLAWPSPAQEPTATKPAESVEATRAKAAEEKPAVDVDSRQPVERLGDIIQPVLIEGASAQRSFEWWSQVTRIPLVIDWEAMRAAGVDPDTKIDINLQAAPAGTVLALLIKRISSEETPVMYEVTPWYLEVLTKTQADKRVVMRTYDIRSLMMQVPDFRPAADFDLKEALNNDNATGGGGGGGKLFGQNTTTVIIDRKTDKERGEEIASIIRDTVEPDVWEEKKPGAPGSIRYFQGRLIVRAPLYVHRQIGLPDVSVDARKTGGDATGGGERDNTSDAGGDKRVPARAAKVDQSSGNANPVAGKHGQSAPVAGVH